MKKGKTIEKTDKTPDTKGSKGYKPEKTQRDSDKYNPTGLLRQQQDENFEHVLRNASLSFS